MEDLTQVLTPIKELLLAKPLKDKDLMAQENPIVLKADKSYPLTLADVVFTFGAGAEVDIMLFNDEDDKDSDNFLSTNNTLLTFNTANEAFLKYTNAISAKANGQVSLQDIGFNVNLSASGNAKTLFYKKHNNAENINQAFLADMAAFKTILRFEDIQNLEEGNALGLMVNGTLTAGLEFSWSNIFSQGLSVVTKFLPAPVTIDINLTPSFSATFNISVTDDFAYIIKKEANDQCLVSVNKKKSSATSASAGVSIGVAFANPDEAQSQLSEIYDKLCESIFGHSAAEISDAIEKFKQGTADLTQNDIINALLAYFKSDKSPAGIQALVDKLLTLQQNFFAVIEKIAHSSVTASFGYQYQRISENTEILSVSIATHDLANFHSQLLRFNPSGLLDGMRNKKLPFTLHSYLNQKVLTINKSFGFGIKLLDLVSITSKDYKDQQNIISTNFTGNKQITFDITRGYQWKLNKQQGSWLGDFNAAMPGYSVSQAPTMNEFNFNLMMDMITVNPKMKLSDLKSYLDAGVLWSSALASDTATLINKYVNAGHILAQNVTGEIKLVFGDDTLKPLLQKIGSGGWNSANINYMANAMAASMSWLEDFQWRATPAIRQKIYAPLWVDFLTNFDPSQDPSDSVADYGAKAEEFIRKSGNTDHLANFEGNQDNWTFGDSFAGVIRSNPGLFDAIKGVVNNLALLQNMIQSQQICDVKRFSDWLNGFMTIFSQSFYTRSLGYFLLLHASDLSLTNNITKVFTLTVGTDPNVQVINATVA